MNRSEALGKIQPGKLVIQVDQDLFQMSPIAWITCGLKRTQGSDANHKKSVAPGTLLKLFRGKSRFRSFQTGHFSSADLVFDRLTFPTSGHSRNYKAREPHVKGGCVQQQARLPGPGGLWNPPSTEYREDKKPVELVIWSLLRLHPCRSNSLAENARRVRR